MELGTTVQSTLLYAMTNVTAKPTVSNQGSNTEQIAFNIIHAVIGVLGIAGNGLVLSVFLTNLKSFQTLTQLLILHQSIIDFTSSLVFTILRMDRYTPLLDKQGLVGEIFCRLWHSEYPLWALFMTSTLNLVLLSTERYIAVVHPVYHMNKLNRKKLKISMVVIWIISFVYQSYLAWTSTNIDGECMLSWADGTESVQTFVGVLTFLLEYMTPLCVMSVEYILIAFKLRELDIKRERRRSDMLHMRRENSSTATNFDRCTLYNSSTATLPRSPMFNSSTACTPLPPDPNDGNGTQLALPDNLIRNIRNSVQHRITPLLVGRPENKFSRAFRNVIKTLIVVFLVNVVCWTPAEFEYFIYNLGGNINFDSIFHKVSVVLILCNMICNPFVYCIQYKEFQSSFKRTFCFCRRDNRVDASALIT